MDLSLESFEEELREGEKESGNVEFKKNLKKDTHLKGKKKTSLIAQMKHRMLSGDGKAIYVIGVNDNGNISGISKSRFEETVEVLEILCEEAEARIADINKENLDSGQFIGIAEIKSLDSDESNQIIVGTAGHVDHGKSTLIGSIVTGEKDDGSGYMRSNLDVLPHELERGLSADISYSVYGFDEFGDVINLESNGSSSKSSLVAEAEKIVSFVDTVGHKPWLHTTIRGLCQEIDYGLLVVAADEGVTSITREHLGILIALDIPTIISVTKSDLVDQEQINKVTQEIQDLLEEVGNGGVVVDNIGVDSAVKKTSKDVYPIIRTSAVTRDGLDSLNSMFYKLNKTSERQSEEFKMYIDETYTVEGVGTVVSGAIKSGTIEKGQDLLIGPYNGGEYKKVKAKSLQIHYHSVDKAERGQLVSVALGNIREEDINRGMVIMGEKEDPEAVKEFEAEVVVLNHPTSIREGYEPVVHIESINETSVVKTSDPLFPGQNGRVRFRFKFNSYNIEEGQKFIFREGESKGIGKVTSIKK